MFLRAIIIIWLLHDIVADMFYIVVMRAMYWAHLFDDVIILTLFNKKDQQKKEKV